MINVFISSYTAALRGNVFSEHTCVEIVKVRL